MARVLSWVWNRGIVSTFLAGLFVVLPIAVTMAIMGWVGGTIRNWLGPESTVGQALSYVGLHFVTDPTVATIIGWLVVLVALWALGVFVKSVGRSKVERTFNFALEHIPIVSTLYKPVVQVLDMFKTEGKEDMHGMSVVYCTFGANGGGGFLGLLASEGVFRFSSQDCNVVYIPTSPVPMTGGIVFVPTEAVVKVEMGVDELMQVYFSVGVLSSKVVPRKYAVAEPAD